MIDTSLNWTDLVQHPGRHDHLVQVYTETDFLVEAVAEYLATGLRAGEGAIVIARPENRRRFLGALEARGVHPGSALRMLDAQETLRAFMVDGMPQWTAFHSACGGAIAELRLQYPTVRAYGEMVDLLWQRGERSAALRLEDFWNELGKLQTFSLLCTYQMDPLDAETYGGALQAVCRCHSHLIPTRDYSRLNEAVDQVAKDVLDQPLAQMLARLASTHRPHAEMPLGQATLIWLKQNMPRTADKVLHGVRAKLAAA
jgi:hypothetical protein